MSLKNIESTLRVLLSMEYTDPYNLAIKYLREQYPEMVDHAGGISLHNLKDKARPEDKSIVLLTDQINVAGNEIIKRELQQALEQKGIKSVI